VVLPSLALSAAMSVCTNFDQVFFSKRMKTKALNSTNQKTAVVKSFNRLSSEFEMLEA